MELLLAIVSISFLIAISQSKGRTRARVIWAFFWCLAGINVYATWQLVVAQQQYVSQLAIAHRQFAFVPANDLFAQSFLQQFWISVTITVALLILPVIWYRRDLQKERAAGSLSQIR